MAMTSWHHRHQLQWGLGQDHSPTQFIHEYNHIISVYFRLLKIMSKCLKISIFVHRENNYMKAAECRSHYETFHCPGLTLPRMWDMTSNSGTVPGIPWQLVILVSTVMVATACTAAATQIDPSYSPDSGNVYPPSNKTFLGLTQVFPKCHLN